MFKKIVSISLALMLILGLASCGGSEMKISGVQSQFYSEPNDITNPISFPDVKTIVGNEKNLIDVKAHGAVSDGETDDTAAVNAAIEAASAVNGIVYFSSGKYLVGDIVVPANVAFAVATSATVTVKDGSKAVINSSDIYLPKKAVLAGAFDFTGGVNYAYPEWFGDGSKGIQGAVNAADKVYLMRTNYQIKETVIIPQSRNIEIIGSSNTATVITMAGEKLSYVFEYIYESGAASNLSVSFIRIVDNTGMNFIKFYGNPANNEGKLEINTMRIENGADTTISVVKNSTGSFYEEIFAANIKLLAKFEGGVNDVTFSRALSLSNMQGFLEADGAINGEGVSKKLYFHNSSSVHVKGIDFIISNYEDVTFIHSSGDLGERETNEAALKMTNVNDFELTRCWWASNTGLSYGAEYGIARSRIGVYLINCTNGKINGNSIVNQWTGVKIVGGSDISLEGNTFQGCGHSELTLDGAKDVTVQGNTFMSGGQFAIMSADVKDPDGIYLIESLSTNENIIFKHNFISKITRAGDAANGDVPGFTLHNNV